MRANRLLIGASALITLTVSLIYLTPSILIFFIFFLAIALALVKVEKKRSDDRVVVLFSISLIVHVMVAYLIWSLLSVFPYQGASDANFYYDISFMSVSDFKSQTVTSYPGFYYINRWISTWSESIGGTHHLVNQQLPIVVGSLLPVYVYSLASTVMRRRDATIAAYIAMLHPLALILSSLLLRDILMSVAVAYLSSIMFSFFKGRNLKIDWLLAAGALILLYNLRTPTALFMVVGLASSYLFFLIMQGSPRVRWLAVLGAIGFIVVALPWVAEALGRASLIWSTHTNVFIQVGDDSLGRSLILAEGPIAWLARFGVLLVSPFPFFVDWVVEGEGFNIWGFMVGLGGLVNSLMLSYFVIGALRSVLVDRRYGLLFAVLIFVGFATMLNLVFVAISPHRFMMTVAPLYWVLAVYGRSEVRRIGQGFLALELWLVALGGLYVAYFMLKSGLPLEWVAVSSIIVMVPGLVLSLLTLRFIFVKSRFSKSARKRYIIPLVRQQSVQVNLD